MLTLIPPTTVAPLQCFPGSNDPRCPRPPPNCYPGSTDFRCPKPFSPKPVVSTTPPRPVFTATTPNPSCYPGSIDPLCPQPYRPASTNPPATYLPPFPAEPTGRSPRQLPKNVINDINNLALFTEENEFVKSDSFSENVHANTLETTRSKRSVDSTKEIISITLNFKGYQFA
jgi:hypothetical protein